MKHFPVVASGVLAIAVLALYILHFTGIGGRMGAATPPEGQVPADSLIAPGELMVAWVNIDTLLQGYDMYFDVRQELEAKGRRLEGEMASKTRAFERQMVDFQDRVQKGLVTRSQAQALQEDLVAKEQELLRIRDTYQMQFMEEEQVAMRRIQHSINEFLEQRNAQWGYHLVLSSSFGGSMLYGHPTLDITRKVLEGLNRQYAQAKQDQRP